MTPKKTPQKILVGAHVSIAGGLHKAVERAIALGATTMQIFTKSGRTWFAKKITQEEAERFKQAVKKTKLIGVTAHSSYLINIASINLKTIKKSLTALVEEIQRCELLSIPYLVLHPGSHVGTGEETGIKKIAKNLDRVLKKTSGKTLVLLETMAGQGTNIGYTFEQLREIIDLCEEQKKIGVCLDTCHIFAAGYDINTPEAYENTIKKFTQILGLRRLKVIHINDSKTLCNSRKDRHASLGTGKISPQAFKLIMNDKRLTNIPKILETPEPELYAEEIRMLKNMVSKK